MPEYNVLYKKSNSLLERYEMPTRFAQLKSDYVVVRFRVPADDLEDLFCKMQGENWSPNGEAINLRWRGLCFVIQSDGKN
jgi:hypothetical protein